MFDESFERMKKGYFEAGVRRYAETIGLKPDPLIIDILWQRLQQDLRKQEETPEKDEI